MNLRKWSLHFDVLGELMDEIGEMAYLMVIKNKQTVE